MSNRETKWRIDYKLVTVVIALLTGILGFAVASFLSFQGVLPSRTINLPVTQVISSEGLQSLQSSFRRITDAVLPSIITIRVEEVREADSGSAPWFDFFFRGPNGQNETPEFRSQGFGSGIIVRKERGTYYAITNEHVVGRADNITIALHDQTEYKALLVGQDTRKDIALISFQSSKDIPLATLGNSDSLQVGDWVLAVGSPFNLQSTVTAGIVSALGRRGGPQGNINDFIQTDAAINQGNSGGALVNISGEVIGMNTWITSRTGTNIGLGFAIPVNNIKKPINDFLKSGSVEYGWLGVSINTITDDEAQDLLLNDTRGALVVNIFNNSPADRAGILPGDFITILNDQEIINADELLLQVGDLPVGKSAQVSIIRQGKTLKLRVRITARESEGEIDKKNGQLWPGMRISVLNDEARDELGVSNNTNGVVVTRIDSNSPAALAGLRTGDVVTAINGSRVTNVLEFYQNLNQKRRGDIGFVFVRQDQTLSIGIVR